MKQLLIGAVYRSAVQTPGQKMCFIAGKTIRLTAPVLPASEIPGNTARAVQPA